MSNTPDEKLREILGEDDWLYTEKPSKIEALITEARVEIWQEVDDLALGYKSYRMSDVAQARLTQLKEHND